MTKIQIKNIENAILFEFEKEENTIKDTLIEGIKQGIDFNNANLSGVDLRGVVLSGADLRGAILSGAYLSGANLRNANLSGVYFFCANLNDADFSGANLNDANFRGAYLFCANFIDANLVGANFIDADLRGAIFMDANLGGAYLSYANLNGANLIGANLRDANLRDANLIGTNLNGAKSVPYIPLVCPSDGEFIGWKKVKSCLIKLKIPFDAKRSSATSQKCRCDKAMVLEIIDLGDNEPIEEIMNDSQDVPLLYRVGEMVYPDSFDENRWNECSHGIHFFINKEEAMRY